MWLGLWLGLGMGLARGAWKAQCRSMMKGCEMRDRMRRSSCACCTTLALVLPLELPCLRMAFIAKRSPVSARVTSSTR